MTARLPSNLLDRSAQESSRLLALAFLHEIEVAHARLADPQDAEALHDFRVGLRRLRSCIRAYRAQLKGSKTKQLEQRLRELTEGTNAGRDTEVHLTWLRKQGEQLGPEDTQGVSWLIGRLEGRKYETRGSVTTGVGRQFLKTATKFRPRLATLRIEVGADHPEKPSFGQVTGELVQQHVTRLARDLERVHQAADIKEVHRARIGIKRLRYMLEPVARRVSGGRGLIARLKEAQDLLGTLHDVHLLSEEIASSIAVFAGSPPDQVPGPLRGLRTLERIATEETAASFQAFEALWGGDRARRFLMRVDEIAQSLVKPSAKVGDGTPGLRLAGGRTAKAMAEVGAGRTGDAAETMIVRQQER